MALLNFNLQKFNAIKEDCNRYRPFLIKTQTIMDNLDELPEAEYSQSPNEQQVMTRFFDGNGDADAKKNGGAGKNGGKSGRMSRVNFKRLGAAVVAFIAVGNPWVDGILEKIPYAQSPVSKLGIKTLIFTVLLLLIMIFVK